MRPRCVVGRDAALAPPVTDAEHSHRPSKRQPLRAEQVARRREDRQERRLRVILIRIGPRWASRGLGGRSALRRFRGFSGLGGCHGGICPVEAGGQLRARALRDAYTIE